jgi:hypothetical protein
VRGGTATQLNSDDGAARRTSESCGRFRSSPSPQRRGRPEGRGTLTIGTDSYTSGGYKNLSPLPELCSVSQLWLTAPPSTSPRRPPLNTTQRSHAAPPTTPITKAEAPNVISIHASYTGEKCKWHVNRNEDRPVSETLRRCMLPQHLSSRRCSPGWNENSMM